MASLPSGALWVSKIEAGLNHSQFSDRLGHQAGSQFAKVMQLGGRRQVARSDGPFQPQVLSDNAGEAELEKVTQRSPDDQEMS